MFMFVLGGPDPWKDGDQLIIRMLEGGVVIMYSDDLKVNTGITAEAEWSMMYHLKDSARKIYL